MRFFTVYQLYTVLKNCAPNKFDNVPVTIRVSTERTIFSKYKKLGKEKIGVLIKIKAHCLSPVAMVKFY